MRRFPRVPISSIVRVVLVCAVLFLPGCSSPGPPPFRLNTEGRDPDRLSPSQVEAITDTLERLFGTPDEPLVPDGVGLQPDLLQAAAGPIGSDEQGTQWGLYRQHCTACHGTSGGGAGPTAAAQNPYPRDFRNGLYKYTSTAAGAKPIRDDLDRILRRGIPATAMPSFGNLPDREIQALIEYVKYLGIRGETELFLLQLVVDEDDYPVRMEVAVEDGVWPVAEMWTAAAETAIPPQEAERSVPPLGAPEQLLASIARGFELYSSKNAQCVQCHGPDGRGDGQQAEELYDDWSKRKRGVSVEQTERLARWFPLPIQRLRPRDFTRGTFHGGERPIDLYWRIHVGIKGTPMPAGGPAPGTSGVLTPAGIWDVVSYVRSRAGSRR